MRFISKVLWYIYMQIKFGRIHSLKKSLFHLAVKDRMKYCGKNVVLHPNIEIRNPEGISIGDNSNVNHNCELYGGGEIEIGSGTMVAYYSSIISDMRSFKGEIPLKSPERMKDRIRKKVVIGDDVWIGTKALILPGVHVANHAIVAAGSVVTKSVNEWDIVAGNPARVIGSRLDTEKNKGE